MAITFDGVSSDSLGVYVEGYPSRPIGKRRISVESIPGYNGAYLIDENSYDGYEQRYKISWLPKYVIDDDIVHWLSKLGYKRLVDSDRKTYYRLATVLSLPEIEDVGGLYHTVEVSFLCRPEYYLNSGDTPKTITNGGSLTNPTPFVSKPIIVVTGAAKGAKLTVNGRTIEFTKAVNNGTLDCEREECYNGSIPLNSSVLCSDYPQLSTGINPVTWTGTISSVKITPRWWEI